MLSIQPWFGMDLDGNRELLASYAKRMARVEWAFRWLLKVTCVLFQHAEPQ